MASHAKKLTLDEWTHRFQTLQLKQEELKRVLAERSRASGTVEDEIDRVLEEAFGERGSECAR